MIDLSDLTFIIPIRIYSNEQKLNLNSLLSLFIRDFNTNIIIVEADIEQKFTPPSNINLTYQFIYDIDPVFHKALYRKRLISQADTLYVAIWDEQIICTPENILSAFNILKNGAATLVFPHDSRIYHVNFALSNFFRQTLVYNYLTDNSSLMTLGAYHSKEYACLLNKEKYLLAGGENINFYGTDLDGEERFRRLETLEFGISYLTSPIFKLFSEERVTSIIDEEIRKKNFNILLNTCKT